jgi:transposase InsO family protein
MALRRQATGLHQPRQHGRAHRHTAQQAPRSKHRNPLVGTAFVHTVVDDYSRVAYAEIRADEKTDTAIDVLRRAVTWFAQRGITVERVLSDNGSAYRSHAWRDAGAELGVTHKLRPGRQRSPRPDRGRGTDRSGSWVVRN